MKIKGNQFHPLMIALAVVIIGAFIFHRVGYLDIPLDRDEGSYLYMGYCFMKGLIPYVDFYEMKPPGIFLTYGIFHLLFGYTLTTLHFGLLLLQLVTSTTIFLISFRLFKNGNAALLSSLAYLVFLMLPNFMGFAIVSEQFFILFILLSFLFLTKPSENYKNIIIAGMFLGLAAMLRQHAVFFMLPFIFFLIFLLCHKNKTKSILVFSAGNIFIISILAIYVLIRGGWDEMIYWIWTYPSESYVNQLSWNEGKVYFYNYLNHHFLNKQWPLMSLAFLGFALSVVNIIKSNEKKIPIFILMFFVASFICVVPGFKFYGHYWLMLFPALSMLIGYSYFDFFHKKAQVFVPVIVSILFIVQLVQNKNLYFLYESKDIYQKLYGSNPNFALNKVTDYLSRKIKSSDEIYVFGSEPQVYYQSRKIAKIPHVYVGFLHSENKIMSGFQNETINYLKKSIPEYIVHIQNANSIFMRENSTRDLYNWIFNFENNNYSPIVLTEINDNGAASYYFDQDAQKAPLTKSYIILYKSNK